MSWLNIGAAVVGGLLNRGSQKSAEKKNQQQLIDAARRADLADEKNRQANAEAGRRGDKKDKKTRQSVYRAERRFKQNLAEADRKNNKSIRQVDKKNHRQKIRVDDYNRKEIKATDQANAKAIRQAEAANLREDKRVTRRTNDAIAAKHKSDLAMHQRDLDREEFVQADNDQRTQTNRALEVQDRENMFADLRASAVKGGFNPLTALMATGGAGFGAGSVSGALGLRSSSPLTPLRGQRTVRGPSYQTAYQATAHQKDAFKSGYANHNAAPTHSVTYRDNRPVDRYGDNQGIHTTQAVDYSWMSEVGANLEDIRTGAAQAAAAKSELEDDLTRVKMEALRADMSRPNLGLRSQTVTTHTNTRTSTPSLSTRPAPGVDPQFERQKGNIAEDLMTSSGVVLGVPVGPDLDELASGIILEGIGIATKAEQDFSEWWAPKRKQAWEYFGNPTPTPTKKNPYAPPIRY